MQATRGTSLTSTEPGQADRSAASTYRAVFAVVALAAYVVDLGTNGPITTSQFTAMMDALRGASRVVFVTVHLPASYSWSQSVNQVLEASAAHYPQARIADFATAAAAHPEWFGTDGIHMPIGGPGAIAMAALIKQAVDQ